VTVEGSKSKEQKNIERNRGAMMVMMHNLFLMRKPLSYKIYTFKVQQ
jgi:hypothetical protein